jgi:hypothetical protein
MHSDESNPHADDAELARLLAHVDHAPPPITADDVIERARLAPMRRAVWAAGIVLILALAGVTYALPGSPLRAWLSQPEPAPPEAPQVDRGNGGAILLDASAPALLIFPAPVRGSHLRVVFADRPDIAVRFLPSSGSVDSQPDRLVIAALAPDTFELAVPRAARRVEVRVGDRTVFLKDEGEISADVSPDAEGRYVLPLKGSLP